MKKIKPSDMFFGGEGAGPQTRPAAAMAVALWRGGGFVGGSLAAAVIAAVATMAVAVVAAMAVAVAAMAVVAVVAVAAESRRRRRRRW